MIQLAEYLDSIRNARRSSMGLACVGACLFGLLVSASAVADSYKVIGGTLSDAQGDRREPLRGHLDISPCDDCVSEIDSRKTFWVDSFLLQSAEATFEPIRPIEFQGLTPLMSLVPRSFIQTLEGRSDQLIVHSGGIPVPSAEETPTFGFFIFAGEGTDRGRLRRRGGEQRLSARLGFEGTVHAYTETYAVTDRCVFGPPVPPGDVDRPAPGDVTIIAVPPVDLDRPAPGDVTIIAAPPGDLELPGSIVLERPEFPQRPGVDFVISVPDDGAGAVLSIQEFPHDLVVIDGERLDFRPIAGAIAVEAPVHGAFINGMFIDGSVVRLPVAGIEIPSLADLGITAPDGAEVTVEEGGVLRIESDGTLYIDGLVADFEWLTALEIIAENIVVNGNLDLGPDVLVSIDTPSAEIDPPFEIDPPSEITLPPEYPPIEFEPACLVWISRSDPQEVGSFSLLASRFQPVEIDVRPGKRRNRILLGRERSVKVAVLGSEDLDVRKVRTRTLRFGPDGASGELRRSGWRERYRDVNRDGYRDLVVKFDVRRTGIAPGDTTACLTGELRNGTLIEGCDEIETRFRPRHWWGRYRH